MAHPEYIYYALLVLLVIPSMPWNRMAIVVVLAWLPGQVIAAAYPELAATHSLAPVRVICYSTAAIAGYFLSYNTGTSIVCSLCIMTAIIAVLDCFKIIHPYNIYWADYWTAILKCIFVPLGNDWRPFCRWLYKHGFIKNPNADFNFYTPVGFLKALSRPIFGRTPL
jgi:hypothetical protein